MPSQKSTSAGAKAPSRQRGRERVVALLDAAAAVFAARGYEAATMTEIAAAAKASIGSLYQFFPSKDALAEALVERYLERLGLALAALAAQAPGRSATAIADSLVDLMVDVRSERTAALALLDARGASALERQVLRDAMRVQIATILRATAPGLSETAAAAMASMILHVLKGIPGLAQEDEEHGTDLVVQARSMIRLYVIQGFAASGGG